MSRYTAVTTYKSRLDQRQGVSVDSVSSKLRIVSGSVKEDLNNFEGHAPKIQYMTCDLCNIP